MSALIAGLAIFLGMHFIHILAPDWRAAQMARLGEKAWKGIFSVASLAGFGLLVWGYGQARLDPVVLWQAPRALNAVVSLLMLPAFILLVAAYVPGNRIKAMVGHPMVASVKLWAFAHLVVNGNLADVLLFGGFLVWAVMSFVTNRKRDRLSGKTYPVGPVSRTVITVVVGTIVYALFAGYLHLKLIGVSPLA
ncbi:MAG: NnrU family protein [Rhodocyclaceae bacterium]|nr:NnrU family protein [Rhodocyclaceae bacterium]